MLLLKLTGKDAFNIKQIVTTKKRLVWCIQDKLEKNGIDPMKTISMLQTFVFPISFYCLKMLLPTGKKNLKSLSKQYKK